MYIILKDQQHPANCCFIMEVNVLKREELHVPDNSWGSHLYCVTRRGETALAFESRMQNNYIQLTKDSLGSSPTEKYTWQGQAVRERSKLAWMLYSPSANKYAVKYAVTGDE